jgi:hypothetical protein
MDALSELRASVRTVLVWELESTGWTGLFLGEAIVSFYEFSHAGQGVDLEDHCIISTLLGCQVNSRCRSMDLRVIGLGIRWFDHLLKLCSFTCMVVDSQWVSVLRKSN